MANYTAIGGQALIEGILMKSPEKAALAVRIPDGTIDITDFSQKSVRDRFPILKWPFLRGVVSFVEAMIQGYRAMMISADKSGFTDLEEDAGKKQGFLMGALMTVATVLGVVLAVVLFMYLPRKVVGGLEWLTHREFSGLTHSFLEQFLKLVVFVAYVWAVSLMKDIKRVFMYHGAEHKTIFCYEKGLPLTVENVREQRRFHPRCGTSFMILMILVSVIFSTIVQILFPGVYRVAWLWVVIKILLIPLVCGAGFELLKICGKYDNRFTKIISAPGLWLQRITTKEPEDDMIEIAIAALRACEPETPDIDRRVDQTPAPAEQPEEKTEASHDNLSGL